ncbi:MAG: chromosomal replication initiator protein DnaA [Thermoleophilaceae bacterium]|nr:chromosomal replication initiator protein DnaA [Thermoleophilaceae bacterium]
MEFNQLWLDTCAVFRQLSGDDTCDVWLSQLYATGGDSATLFVSGSKRARSWVECRHMRSFTAALAAASQGQVRKLLLVEEADGHSLVSQTSKSVQNVVKQQQLDGPPLSPSSFNPRYTFEQFVIGHGNRSAHAAALAVAELPAQAFNPLFIYGPPGQGKTHLLHAIANFHKQHSPEMQVTYLTAEAFAVAFRKGLTAGSIDAFKAQIRASDVLLIDDIQFLQKKVRTEEEFFHTFNALMENGRQLIVTADRMPRELTALAERMRDRFESGLVVDIDPPDNALLTTILRKRVQSDNIPFPDEAALNAIAARVPGNIRSLEGALIRVCALSSLRAEPITGDLVDEVLRKIYPTQQLRNSTVRDIQRVVSEHFGLNLEQLTSAARDRKIVRPRQIAMYLSCELTSDSLSAIAHEFGRDHSTVLYARDKIDGALSENPEVKDTVDKLRAMFDVSTSDRANI